MNHVEFLEEVKASPLCPPNFETIYTEFQEFQKAALDTLLEVHRVCEKNGVPYHLQYGSLLGFIRDGGLIPWDYDIDIAVPYEEKGNLITALKKDLDPKYYFYCPDTDKKCRHMIMRIAPNEYTTAALHVDVFFFVGTPEDEAERKRFSRRIKELSDIRFQKLVKVDDIALGDPIKAVKYVLRTKLPVMFTNLSAGKKEYDALCSTYSSSESTYCISADVSATWNEIPTRLLWETKTAECDYGTVRIPVHYEKLLEFFYGDYKSVPPLENRIKEVLDAHKTIKYLQSKKR